MYRIHISELQNLLGNTRGLSEWHTALSELMPKYEIDTPLRAAAFISQCQHESYNFRRLEEDLRYSAEQLEAVFGRRVAGRDLKRYEYNPKKIANLVYANAIGNGPEESGDGWKYHGRGIIQLTGKANYMRFGREVGMSAPQVIDYVVTKRGAVHAACWFWDMRKINRAADEGDLEKVTRLINGGLNGLEDRRRYYERALNILGVSAPELGSNTGTRFIQLGDTGPLVQQLQRALNMRTADGIFGPSTERAVKNFQRRSRLIPDGIAGPRTLIALGL